MRKDIDWRPGRLQEYIGQTALIRQLEVELASSFKQKRALNHMVFHGAGGLGKTTLIDILAAERSLCPPVYMMGRECTHESLTATLGMLGQDGKDNANIPGYDRKGNLIDPSVAPFPIVVIDEAEAIEPSLFEILHRGLEADRDGIRRMMGREVCGRQVKQWDIWLVHFTMIVITNYIGQLVKKAGPTMSRFPIKYQFEFYSDGEIAAVTRQYANVIGADITDDAVTMLASRCHGVPRAAVQYVRRAVDFLAGSTIDQSTMARMFDIIGVDQNGLDRAQIRYLHAVADIGGGKLGVEAIASILSTDRMSLENLIEPPLLRKGMVIRTASGREITSSGRMVIHGASAIHPLYSRGL